MVDRRLPVVIGKLRGSRHSVAADRLPGARTQAQEDRIQRERTARRAFVLARPPRPAGCIRRVVRKRVSARRAVRSAQTSKKNPAARVRHAQPTLSARRGRFSNPKALVSLGLKLVKWAGSGFWMLSGRLFVSDGREVPPGRGTGGPNRGIPAYSAPGHGRRCGRQDSNLHGLPHGNLNPARLPIPPRPHDDRGSVDYRPVCPAGQQIGDRTADGDILR